MSQCGGLWSHADCRRHRTENQMEAWDAIRARRNVRRYLPVPVSERDLDRSAEAGWRAPSASNRQHWDFVIVTEHRHWKNFRRCGGAPVTSPRPIAAPSPRSCTGDAGDSTTPCPESLRSCPPDDKGPRSRRHGSGGTGYLREYRGAPLPAR